MKTLFLTSSFATVAHLFEQFSLGKCKGKTVTFIPTASAHEQVKFYVQTGKDALEQLGMVIDELDISTTNFDDVSRRILRNDYIYVTGGNTFYLLQELRRTGVDKILSYQIETGKPYIGESAGSIILSKNIEYVKDFDDVSAAPDLKSYDSLGLVDFYPLPHFTNPPFAEIAANILLDYQDKIKLLPFSDLQVITMANNRRELLTSKI
jgi:dipeptidase E